MPIKKGNKLVELRGDVIKGLARVYESGLQPHQVLPHLLTSCFLML